MKKIWQNIKNFKWGYLLFAVLFTAGGLCFLSFPEDALKGVRIGIGVTAIVFAVAYIALTLANEERGFRFWAKMVLGGVATVCGGFMIFSRQGAFEYLTFIAGIYLMIDGSFKLQTAILSKRYRSAVWWIMLVLSAAAIAFGTVLIRAQFDFSEELVKVSKILGIAFTIDGIQNLLSIGYLYYVEHKTRETLREDLRARGELVTVLDDGTAAPAGEAGEKASGEGEKRRLTRAEKRAAKQREKQAAIAAAADTVDVTTTAPAEPAGTEAYTAEEPQTTAATCHAADDAAALADAETSATAAPEDPATGSNESGVFRTDCR